MDLNRIELLVAMDKAQEELDEAVDVARKAQADNNLTTKLLDDIGHKGETYDKLYQQLMHAMSCEWSERAHLIEGAKSLKGK